MDMGDMEMLMDLRLKTSCKVGALFFDFWSIQTCGQFAVSCVLITLLCFLRHLLQMHKTRFILSLPTDEALDGSATSLLRQSCCAGPSTSSTTSYQSVEEGRNEGSKLAVGEPTMKGVVNGLPLRADGSSMTKLRINLRLRILLTLYFSLLGGLSILVMLLAMTFNVGIIIAVLVGEGAGHFYFSTDFYHDLLQSGSFH